ELANSGKLNDSQLRSVIFSLGSAGDAYAAANEKTKDNAFFNAQAADAAGDSAAAQDGMAESTKEATAETQKQSDAFKAATDALNKMIDAQDSLIGSNLSYGDAQRAVN